MTRTKLPYFYVGRWKIVIMREQREIVLISPYYKTMTITRNTKLINGLPDKIIETLVFANLIPDYIKVV